MMGTIAAAVDFHLAVNREPRIPCQTTQNQLISELKRNDDSAKIWTAVSSANRPLELFREVGLSNSMQY